MRTIHFIKKSAAVLVIAAVALAGCGKDDNPGDKNIPVLVKAYNNEGVAPPASLSKSRSAVGERSDLVRAAEHPSFGELNDLYTPANLGAKVGSGITPTKFTASWSINAVLSNGDRHGIGAGSFFDFTKGLTVDVGEVPTGITVSALELHIASVRMPGEELPMIEFEKPSGLSAETINQMFEGYNPPVLNGNTMSLSLGHFTMMEVGENEFASIMDYFCYGDELKLQTGTVTFPGGSPFGQPAPARNMIIPFSPVTISEDASSVTLNISWDLNGLIEQWSGEDNTPNNADDRFVFKQGWWNNLHVAASVQ